MKRAPSDGSAHGQAKHVASGDEIPDRRCCGRIDAPASSRPMLCKQKSPITVPNVPEMNMQTQ
jgi:hypothetical protein